MNSIEVTRYTLSCLVLSLTCSQALSQDSRPSEIGVDLGKPVDLLAQLSIPRDRVAGVWHKCRDGYETDGEGSPARVKFRTPPPDEYELKVDFTRLEGNRPVGLILCVGTTSVLFVMGQTSQGISGLSLVDGKGTGENETDFVLPKLVKIGVRHTAVVKVRNDSVTCFIDEQQVLTYPKDSSRLALPPNLDLGGPCLGFSAASATVLHSAELIPVRSGIAKRQPPVKNVDAQKPAVNPPIDPASDPESVNPPRIDPGQPFRAATEEDCVRARKAIDGEGGVTKPTLQLENKRIHLILTLDDFKTLNEEDAYNDGVSCLIKIIGDNPTLDGLDVTIRTAKGKLRESSTFYAARVRHFIVKLEEDPFQSRRFREWWKAMKQ